VLFRFCPAIRHCPGGASSDWPRALNPETNKSAANNTAFDNDRLQFFFDIFFLLLVFDRVTTLAWLLCQAFEHTHASCWRQITIRLREWLRTPATFSPLLKATVARGASTLQAGFSAVLTIILNTFHKLLDGCPMIALQNPV